MYKPTSQQSNSITFTCNLDSMESISELVKRVYNIITPKCNGFKGRIRRYGNYKTKHFAYFITIPKPLMNFMFTEKEQNELEMKEDTDVHFYFDKNTLKRTNKDTGKEEMILLVKIIKKRNIIDNKS